MSFGARLDSLLGHRDIIAKLKESIRSGNVSHAYIFHGPEGVGKTTAAGAFARELICLQPDSSGRSCGKCQACRLFDAGTNPDFTLISPVKDVIKVDDIRDMQSEIVLNPLYSGHKVCVIEDAHLMNTQAQNCLLKTLEEPPAYAVIILTTSDLAQLLETIRSRSVALAFGRLPAQDVRRLLDELKPGLPNAEFLAAYAEGSIGKALKLGSDEKFAAVRDKAFKAAEALTKARPSETFDGLDFFTENKESIGDILETMVLAYRDALVRSVSGDENLLINADKKDIILNIAGKIPPSGLENAIDAAGKAAVAIKQNANFNSAVEAMLLRIRKGFIDG